MSEKWWKIWDVIILLVAIIMFLIVSDDSAWNILMAALNN